MSKRGLGKGLQALIPTTPKEDIATSGNKKSVEEIKIISIVPNSKQPRRIFDEEKLSELAASIKEHGVVQPIVVRKLGTKYEIVAGERRWRACQLLGLKAIPAVVKEYTDEEVTEIALIENIQRENLNPIEEAQAYKQLMERFGFKQEQLAVKLGKSRPYIANSLRLLNLSTKVIKHIESGQLSQGHARALLGLATKELQEEIANIVIEKGLSVRDTEDFVKSLNSKTEKGHKSKLVSGSEPNIFRDIEEQFRSFFGTKVRINEKGNKGKIEIEYYNEDDLNRIIELLIGPDKL